MDEREQRLLDIVRSLESTKEVARVLFRDGESYDLKIVDTGHAEDGGDVAAEVASVIHTHSPQFRWDDAFMNFFLRHVVRVESGAKCLYDESI